MHNAFCIFGCVARPTFSLFAGTMPLLPSTASSAAALAGAAAAAYRRGLAGGVKRARALQGAPSPFFHRASPLSTASGPEKLPPTLPTERGLAAEQGQLPRRWIDEPVPALSVSAVEEFPGCVQRERERDEHSSVGSPAPSPLPIEWRPARSFTRTPMLWEG